MSVNVKYKDDTIANLSDTGTKTLKTGGKYCEGDILIDYVKPESTGITPSGTKSITTNGEHDVTNYAKANVNVPVPSGYIKPSGTKTITGNGTHDVSAYASALVNVPIPEMPNIKTWLHTVSSDVGAAGSVVVTGDSDIASHYADNDAFAMYVAVGSTLPTSGRFFCFNGNKTISSNTKYGIYTDKSASSNYNSTGALKSGSGEIIADSTGQLKIVASGSYKLKAGTYLVVFGWN